MFKRLCAVLRIQKNEVERTYILKDCVVKNVHPDDMCAI